MKILAFRIFKWLLIMIYGGMIFWIPNILIHRIAGNNYDSYWVLLCTAILPLITIGGIILLFFLEKMHHISSIAFWILFGIWFFGPFYIIIESLLLDPSYILSDIWKLLFQMIPLFPIFTFMISTYDGSLFAVLIMTVILGITFILGFFVKNLSVFQINLFSHSK